MVLVVGIGSNMDFCVNCDFGIFDCVCCKKVRWKHMGLWKVDNVSSEEWERRMLRRHDIKQWTITIIEIAGMVGAVIGIAWLMGFLGI